MAQRVKKPGMEQPIKPVRAQTLYEHNGRVFKNEPYVHKGATYFAIGTGGGLQTVYVEEGSTCWVHWHGKDQLPHSINTLRNENSQ